MIRRATRPANALEVNNFKSAMLGQIALSLKPLLLVSPGIGFLGYKLTELVWWFAHDYLYMHESLTRFKDMPPTMVSVAYAVGVFFGVACFSFVSRRLLQAVKVYRDAGNIPIPVVHVQSEAVKQWNSGPSHAYLFDVGDNRLVYIRADTLTQIVCEMPDGTTEVLKGKENVAQAFPNTDFTLEYDPVYRRRSSIIVRGNSLPMLPPLELAAVAPPVSDCLMSGGFQTFESDLPNNFRRAVWFC